MLIFTSKLILKYIFEITIFWQLMKYTGKQSFDSIFFKDNFCLYSNKITTFFQYMTLKTWNLPLCHRHPRNYKIVYIVSESKSCFLLKFLCYFRLKQNWSVFNLFLNSLRFVWRSYTPKFLSRFVGFSVWKFREISRVFFSKSPAFCIA